MSIQLRHIEFAIAAAEHGSFRAAAAALRVRESTISRQIRDLEYSLGGPLFIRSATGVRLNAAGREFVSRARRALCQLELAKGAIGRRIEVEQGELRIGIFSSLASGFLSDLIYAYRSRFENVQLTFVECNPAEHVAAIRNHATDVAFLAGTSGWSACESQPLWAERVFAALRQDHPLADREQIDLHDLADHRFIVSESPPGEEIHYYLIQRLAKLGHHPDIQQQGVGRDNLMRLVALGLGLTLTSQATTAIPFPGIAYVPITDENVPFSAVWSPDNPNPALHRLLEAARALAAAQEA